MHRHGLLHYGTFLSVLFASGHRPTKTLTHRALCRLFTNSLIITECAECFQDHGVASFLPLSAFHICVVCGTSFSGGERSSVANGSERAEGKRQKSRWERRAGRRGAEGIASFFVSQQHEGV